VTATPEVAESTPEVAEQQPSKTFSQEELDAAIGKRLAREQRKWEREQAQRQSEQQTLRAAPAASADQFESTEAYAEALALQKAEELIAKREAAKQQSQVLESYHDLEEEARGKYDDFEQVAYNPKLPITNVMAETIQSSDVGPELAYYLGSNPKEAERISRMTPLSQAKEIGKIEAKLVSSPPVKKTTSAPAPISPVTARSSGSTAYDTTDPRSTKTMTDSQWIEAERRRQQKKWEAQNR
jgi:beta-glucosidase-like glycosyl hydrolase